MEVSLIAEGLLTGTRTLCTQGRFVLVAADKPEVEPGMPAIVPDDSSLDKHRLLKPSVETRMAEIVFPEHTNHYGTLFGRRCDFLDGQSGLRCGDALFAQGRGNGSIGADRFQGSDSGR